MKDIDAALAYLNRDYIMNVSVIDPIVSGTGDVLYASDSCVFLQDRNSGVYLLQATDLSLAYELIADIRTDVPLVVHSTELADMAAKRGYNSNVPCFQAVYMGEPPHLTTELDIRLLGEENAEEAAELYGFFDLESAKRHISMGLVYGGFIGDELAGMVGMHPEGSMGMLEVKEKFRRRGYGEALEKFIISTRLSSGHAAYCHIIEDNVVSLSLQKKLGLKISDGKLYWLHKR